jgi:hypothetical protein
LTLPHANLNLCLTFMNIHMVVAFKLTEQVHNTAAIYTAHMTTAPSPMVTSCETCLSMAHLCYQLLKTNLDSWDPCSPYLLHRLRHTCAPSR